jgi:TRAP-type C4-dicarboxylate transport system permease small subunit
MTRWIYGLSRALAWLGGVVLVVISLISVTSILGRALSLIGLGPVPGDFELVEMGTALAVFCFLPWCHLKNGHAFVDLLWNAYPAWLQQVLQVLTELLTLVVWGLLIWRMGVALQDYRSNGETSFILGVPVWWGYGASLLPAVFGVFVIFWRLLETLGLAKPPADFAMSVGEH